MDTVVDEPKIADGIDALLRDVARIGALPLGLAETLPPAAYTSEAFFQREVKRAFRPGWMCVAHVSQLPTRGDYLSVDWLGELMVIVNDGQEIRALSRVCRHRWAPVCTGRGNLSAFVCPFHKWSYALDGQLIGAPLMEEAVDFDLDACALPEYRSEVVDGFVFVNLDGNAAPLAPAMAEMSAALANYQLDRLVVGSVLEYDCRFNWKIMVETFMECYHHIGPHADTFEPDFPAKLSYVEDSRAAWTRGFGVGRPEAVPEAFDVGLPRFPLVNEEECEAFGLYLVYPCHMLATFPDRVVWFHAEPIAADRTRLRSYQMLQPETTKLPDFAKMMAIQDKTFDVINLEDIDVNVMQQVGAKSGMVKSGRLSHLEKAIWQLNQFVARAVTVP
jgi:phenylpropionate dioxygenase-like ring-hydroxylating dioxygenase large terminal subunit